MTIADIPPSESACILANLKQVLRGQFHIGHTTIQFEHVGCEDSRDASRLPRSRPSHMSIITATPIKSVIEWSEPVA